MINERTGTIIIDEMLRSACGYQPTRLEYSYPGKSIAGQTNVYPYGGRGALYAVPQGTKPKDLVDALTAMQVSTKI